MSGQPDHVGDVSQVLRVGRIASVNRAAATCTVAVGDPDADDGETLTSDIPWLVPCAGETAVWSPPSEGEQVLLFCPDGDIAQAVAAPGIFSTAFPAPGAGTREFIRFADGAELGYDPDSAKADVTLPSGGKLSIVADGGVTIEGNLSVTGEIEATGDVVAQGISLATHRHSGVQAGGADTGLPE